MSWEIKQEGALQILRLEGDIGIQDAIDFYNAVLPLGGFTGTVHVDASGVKSMHTAIFQILYALSKAVSEFQITERSGEYLAAETRVGVFLSKIRNTETTSTASNA